ncbi:hypothetical protein, partial [Pseudomonas chlororaphis]|uniref:hypothetical protein n=1 Tax=Pseudomonas chlororaphis TaxID=587753 RepID=UPI003C24A0BD
VFGLPSFLKSLIAKWTKNVGLFQTIPNDTPSTDILVDTSVEAIFLRAFTAYENDVEQIFLHYVTGGRTLNNFSPTSYLNTTDRSLARSIVKGSNKFISWAQADSLARAAKLYMHEGWPMAVVVSANSQFLSDGERVRNRIAHNSSEAIQQFKVVQRNMLGTERLFDLSPGQFLRMKHTRQRILYIDFYMNVLNQALLAMMEPAER